MNKNEEAETDTGVAKRKLQSQFVSAAKESFFFMLPFLTNIYNVAALSPLQLLIFL